MGSVLHAASANGHFGVTELLIECERTPLQVASVQNQNQNFDVFALRQWPA